ALHRAGGELRQAVRAPVPYEVRLAALAAVNGQVLAHDADRLRVARIQQSAHVDRLPELAQVASGERSGAGVDEVDLSGRSLVRLAHRAGRLDAGQGERPVFLQAHLVRLLKRVTRASRRSRGSSCPT